MARKPVLRPAIPLVVDRNMKNVFQTEVSVCSSGLTGVIPFVSTPSRPYHRNWKMFFFFWLFLKLSWFFSKVVSELVLESETEP